ncbi:hypothetical protein VTK73DRAFT_9833 [Phialemonium thermophilum]|uniref:Uncharacterized protein n=1 Tax=Phialemonium thermophilum TaxID=223376 RepID=A0ABR3VZZ9_9PEZI
MSVALVLPFSIFAVFIVFLEAAYQIGLLARGISLLLRYGDKALRRAGIAHSHDSSDMPPDKARQICLLYGPSHLSSRVVRSQYNTGTRFLFEYVYFPPNGVSCRTEQEQSRLDVVAVPRFQHLSLLAGTQSSRAYQTVSSYHNQSQTHSHTRDGCAGDVEGSLPKLIIQAHVRMLHRIPVIFAADHSLSWLLFAKANAQIPSPTSCVSEGSGLLG